MIILLYASVLAASVAGVSLWSCRLYCLEYKVEARERWQNFVDTQAFQSLSTEARRLCAAISSLAERAIRSLADVADRQFPLAAYKKVQDKSCNTDTNTQPVISSCGSQTDYPLLTPKVMRTTQTENKFPAEKTQINSTSSQTYQTQNCLHSKAVQTDYVSRSCSYCEDGVQTDTLECSMVCSAIQTDRVECQMVSSAIQTDSVECRMVSSAIQTDSLECRMVSSAIQTDKIECRMVSSAIQTDKIECRMVSSAIQTDLVECRMISCAVQTDSLQSMFVSPTNPMDEIHPLLVKNGFGQVQDERHRQDIIATMNGMLNTIISEEQATNNQLMSGDTSDNGRCPQESASNNLTAVKTIDDGMVVDEEADNSDSHDEVDTVQSPKEEAEAWMLSQGITTQGDPICDGSVIIYHGHFGEVGVIAKTVLSSAGAEGGQDNLKDPLSLATIEINISMDIDHPFIVKTLMGVEERRFTVMVRTGSTMMPFRHVNNAINSIRSQHGVGLGAWNETEDLARFVGACIIQALIYLHERHQVVHRNICPEAVYIDDKGYAILCDLSQARPVREKKERLHGDCGTVGYQPPEIIADFGHRFPTDFWELGCLMYEVLVGHTPYADDEIDKIRMRTVLNPDFAFTRLSRNDTMTMETKRFIKRLLDPIPWRRSNKEIWNHKWFDRFEWDALNKKQLISPIIHLMEQNTTINTRPSDHSSRHCGQYRHASPPRKAPSKDMVMLEAPERARSQDPLIAKHQEKNITDYIRGPRYRDSFAKKSKDNGFTSKGRCTEEGVFIDEYSRTFPRPNLMPDEALQQRPLQIQAQPGHFAAKQQTPRQQFQQQLRNIQCSDVVGPQQVPQHISHHDMVKQQLPQPISRPPQKQMPSSHQQQTFSGQDVAKQQQSYSGPDLARQQQSFCRQDLARQQQSFSGPDGARQQQSFSGPDGARQQQSFSGPDGARQQQSFSGPDGARQQQSFSGPDGARQLQSFSGPDGARQQYQSQLFPYPPYLPNQQEIHLNQERNSDGPIPHSSCQPSIQRRPPHRPAPGGPIFSQVQQPRLMHPWNVFMHNLSDAWQPGSGGNHSNHYLDDMWHKEN